jgi:hypothetical protein
MRLGITLSYFDSPAMAEILYPDPLATKGSSVVDKPWKTQKR